MKLYETAELEAELFDGSAELENFSEEEYIENLEDIPSLELTLELADGRTLIYELAGVFIHEEKEYAALHPKSESRYRPRHRIAPRKQKAREPQRHWYDESVSPQSPQDKYRD